MFLTKALVKSLADKFFAARFRESLDASPRDTPLRPEEREALELAYAARLEECYDEYARRDFHRVEADGRRLLLACGISEPERDPEFPRLCRRLLKRLLLLY